MSPALEIADTSDRSAVCGQGCRTMPSIHQGTGPVPPTDSGATSRRFRGSVRLLRLWFVPAGSPPVTQLVQDCGRWADVSRLSGFPGRGERFMESAALFVRKVITFVVCHEVDNGPLGQRCRLVQDEPAVLDTSTEGAHAVTVRVSEPAGKSSGCATKPVDFPKPRGDLVPTGRH